MFSFHFESGKLGYEHFQLFLFPLSESIDADKLRQKILNVEEEEMDLVEAVA